MNFIKNMVIQMKKGEFKKMNLIDESRNTNRNNKKLFNNSKARY